MNWHEKCDIDIKEIDNTLVVKLKVNHIRGQRNFQEKTYTTQFIKEYLFSEKIAVGEVQQEAIVFNYQSEKRTSGTWIFSLPKKKKPTKSIEKKETVSKITNKKTTKK